MSRGSGKFKWLEIDGKFAIQGGGYLHHGIEGEVGFVLDDLGDVGGRIYNSSGILS
jgi:hypothetical protein